MKFSKDFENLWDFGLFQKEDEILIGGIHYPINSKILQYRGDFTTDNYECKDTFVSELNRYYQENVYND